METLKGYYFQIPEEATFHQLPTSLQSNIFICSFDTGPQWRYWKTGSFDTGGPQWGVDAIHPRDNPCTASIFNPCGCYFLPPRLPQHILSIYLAGCFQKLHIAMHCHLITSGASRLQHPQLLSSPGIFRASRPRLTKDIGASENNTTPPLHILSIYLVWCANFKLFRLGNGIC